MRWIDSRSVKILACVLMVVDHIGVYFYPDIVILRIIGRISFPLFAFLIAFSCTKTRNLQKFVIRLFVFAVIVQAILMGVEYLLFDFVDTIPNVFVVLALGALCVWLFNIRLKVLGILFCIAIIVGCAFWPLLWANYGSAGILLILLLYLGLKYTPKYQKLLVLPSLVVFNLLIWFELHWATQWWSLLSWVFILMFSDRKIKISKAEKWAFYVFYPLHLVIIHITGYLIFVA